MSSTNTSWSVEGNTKAGGSLASSSSDISIQATKKLYLDGGGNTYITESSADTFDLYVGGIQMLTSSASVLAINEGSVDADFRVESNGNANMLFVDGGNNRVGIGTSTPPSDFVVSNANDGGAASLIIQNPHSGASTDETAELYFSFYNSGDANSSTFGAKIVGGKEETFAASGTRSGFLAFHTKADGSSAERMRIDKSGKVGIGATSPSNLLEIAYEDTGTQGKGLLLANTDTSIAGDQLLGSIGFDSYDGNVPDNNLEASAYIAAYASESHGTSDKGGYLTFGTAPENQDDDTTSSERMRILDNGNVGIGTTPGFPLHIVGAKTTSSTTTFSQLRIEDTSDFDGSPVAGISFSGRNIDGSTGAVALGAIHVKKLNSTSANESSVMEFLTRLEGSNPAVAMTIDENGKVGIGEDTPTASLQVNQGGSTAAINVMKLHQNDADKPFIDFSGSTGGAETRSVSTDTTENDAKFGAIMIQINGVTKWIRVYDGAQ
tara:strand:- start:1620 stop:3098 length:1479 start_codon:yes stop_codon:yes gene_type:complete